MVRAGDDVVEEDDDEEEEEEEGEAVEEDDEEEEEDIGWGKEVIIEEVKETGGEEEEVELVAQVTKHVPYLPGIEARHEAVIEIMDTLPYQFQQQHPRGEEVATSSPSEDPEVDHFL